jgi:hypothetical protein
MKEKRVLFSVSMFEDDMTEVHFDSTCAQDVFVVVSSFVRMTDECPKMLAMLNMLLDVKLHYPDLYKKLNSSDVTVPDFNKLLQTNEPNESNNPTAGI